MKFIENVQDHPYRLNLQLLPSAHVIVIELIMFSRGYRNSRQSDAKVVFPIYRFDILSSSCGLDQSIQSNFALIFKIQNHELQHSHPISSNSLYAFFMQNSSQVSYVLW